MYSLAIKTATLVNKAALDDITKPALGFNIANVLELTVEAVPTRFLVIIKSTVLFFKLS